MADPTTPVPVTDRPLLPQGYGVPTTESRAAIELAARTDALFLDPTYTAKAMAGLIARDAGFNDAEAEQFDQLRDKTPAEPVRFE